MYTLLSLNLQVKKIVEELQEANEEGSPLRCRELSAAITNIQQGSHWLSARVAGLDES